MLSLFTCFAALLNGYLVMTDPLKTSLLLSSLWQVLARSVYSALVKLCLPSLSPSSVLFSSLLPLMSPALCLAGVSSCTRSVIPFYPTAHCTFTASSVGILSLSSPVGIIYLCLSVCLSLCWRACTSLDHLGYVEK
ncbi:hypothetical protein MIR68_012208 [Amoeboaphelidium protococcarum]|nr:hypothetical protein MIR68_012208 [Amoeboaphelidium protococcarum]